jgi:hypothetical protein
LEREEKKDERDDYGEFVPIDRCNRADGERIDAIKQKNKIIKKYCQVRKTQIL